MGVPDARAKHAVLMARFARDCLAKFNDMVQELVVELGPDTEDLGYVHPGTANIGAGTVFAHPIHMECFFRLRVGIHSGSVTAG